MKKPSASSLARTLTSHFTQWSPAHPGTTSRSGAPCASVRSSPFIRYASRVVGSSARSMGGSSRTRARSAWEVRRTRDAHVERLLREAGLREHVLQADAGERGLPIRAVRPLHAGHARLVERATVAGALEHRGHRHLGEGGAELVDPSVSGVFTRPSNVVFRARSRQAVRSGSARRTPRSALLGGRSTRACGEVCGTPPWRSSWSSSPLLGGSRIRPRAPGSEQGRHPRCLKHRASADHGDASKGVVGGGSSRVV